MRDIEERHSHYLDSETYRVEQAPSLMPAFQLIREDLAYLDFKPHTKILKEGDRVIFKWK